MVGEVESGGREAFTAAGIACVPTGNHVTRYRGPYIPTPQAEVPKKNTAESIQDVSCP